MTSSVAVMLAAMTAKVGGLTLNELDSDGVLIGVTDDKWTGWGAAASNLTPVQKPRAHGGWAGPSFLTPRTLPIGGVITTDGACRGDPQALILDRFDKLCAALALADTKLTVTEGAATRWAMVRRQAKVQPQWVTDRCLQWQTTLVALDPRKYADPIVASTGLPSKTGGLIWPQKTVTPSPSLVTNGSFEDGVDDWTATHCTIAQASGVAIPQDGGSKSCEITAAGDGSSPTVEKHGFPCEAGTTYVAGAWLQATTSRRWNVLHLTFYDATGAVLLDVDSTPSTPDDLGAWTEYLTATGTAPAGAVTMGIKVNLGAGAVAGEVHYFDGAYIVDEADADQPYGSTTGGLTWPITWTGVYQSGTIHIDNPGDIESAMLLRIDGPVTGPIIRHVSKGVELALNSDYTVPAGSFLLIDTEKRTVLEAGTTSRNTSLISRGWFLFEKGANDLIFDAAVRNDQALLTVTATPAYL